MVKGVSKLFCPVCVERGERSRVYPQGGTRTLMYSQPFYDENGVYHHHDANWHTELHKCSNGHIWEMKRRKPCPNCDYGSEPPKMTVIVSDPQQAEDRAPGPAVIGSYRDD